MDYQLWFNYKRKNRWRGRKPPLEIFQEVPHGEISPQVFNLPSIILDNLLKEIPDYGNLLGFSVRAKRGKVLTGGM